MGFPIGLFLFFKLWGCPTSAVAVARLPGRYDAPGVLASGSGLAASA